MNKILTFVLASSFLFSASSSFADSASFRTNLTPNGSATSARGSVSGSFSEQVSSLTITASRLAPLQNCQLLVDGRVEATATTSRTGALLLRFRSPTARGFSPLNFEPRGKQVELQINGITVLSAIPAGPSATAASSSSEVTDLRRLVRSARSTAVARHSVAPNGVTNFSVSANRLSSSPISVLVNGKPLGNAVTPRRDGTAQIRFRGPSAPAGFLPLTTDPRGATLDVVQDGVSIFTGEMRSRARGINHSTPNSFRLYLPSTQSPAVGEAEAEFSIDHRARRSFEVGLEEVPLGNYTLLVNNIVRGTITVRPGDEENEGEIEFSSYDDDDLPLDFDPVGATLEIQDSAGTTLFSGVFDPSVLNTRPLPEPAYEFTERLTSTGLYPDADGEARYEVDYEGAHYFEVEIEDVPAGTYSLRVGGMHRAILRAALVRDDDEEEDEDDDEESIEGEVEFRSPGERGKITMNFDPRGQLLEIVNASNETFFSHLFGSGSAPTTPRPAPLFLRQALFAEPAAIGVVTATFEIDDEGESELELEARGLPAGTYQVAVGSVDRGTLRVFERGTRTFGELEFETDPDDDELALNFAVLDQEITVSDSSGVLFRRTLTRP